MLLLVAAACVAACGESASIDTSTGSLSLTLEFGLDLEIDEVRWEIAGGDMAAMSGVIDTSAPGATASVEVAGLPPGPQYLVTLAAATVDGEIACRGDASFEVEPGASTEVMVMLGCKSTDRLGGVRVGGELDVCASISKVVVSPLETSLGNSIDLSVLAVDPEGDPIAYFWFGSGGTIADPMSPSTRYTCERFGTHRILLGIRNADDFRCLDTWAVDVDCVPADPSQLMCLPPDGVCSDGSIDPALACCEQPVPLQENACTGDEAIDNPASCTPTGSTVTHRLNVMELAPSCNIGYDLDGCEGLTCNKGGLAPREGLDGVDNALTGIAPVLAGVGFDLSVFNEVLSDSLCGTASSRQGQRCAVATTRSDVRFVIDANEEEGCANVQVVSNGQETGNAILNLGAPTEAGTYCMSGRLGSIPFDILEMPASLDNTALRMTVSEAGFSHGWMGATLAGDTAAAVMESIVPGGSAVVAQVLDINSDLSGDVTEPCDALSVTFSIGGGPDTRGMPQDPVVPYDRTDVRTIAPFPDDYFLAEDPTTKTGHRVSIPTPAREVDVQVLYLALSAETWMLDGFSPIGGITIPLGARPDLDTLPVTDHASLEPSASMRLFDVTPGSESLGARVPFKLSPISMRLPGQSMDHSLVLYPSVPLTPEGRYAMVVTRDALTSDGLPFEPSSFMKSVLEPAQPGEPPEVTRARALLEDGVLDVLGDESLVSPPLAKDDIALVFRFSIRSMDEIHRTPLSMKEQILALPQPEFTIDSVEPWFGDVAAVVRGTWKSPNWREQEYFVARDENGDPRITGELDVPFVLALPKAAEDGPVPVVMFQHGSPGTANDVPYQADFAGLAAEGFAVIGMTDTINREVAPDTNLQSAVLFQTLIQTWRFPHYKLQTYADQMAFLRFLEGLDSLDEVPLGGGDGTPDLDLQAPLTYVGISMGSMHATAFLSYAPEIKAAALVVGSQRQGEQYFREGRFLDIFPPNLQDLIPNARPTDYWIGLGIFQMIFDHQDAHNQAPFLYRKPLEVAGTTKKASVLVVEGLRDTQVPNNATRSLAWTVGHIPHMEPIWEASPILETVTGPVSGNIDSETTAAFYQYVPVGVPGIPYTPGCEFEPEGHFCGQSAPEARLQRLLFLKSAVDDPVPTIVDPFSVGP